MASIEHLLVDPQAWIAFATLTALELVLGIDNIVFISILVDKLAPDEQKRARLIGLFLAMFMHVGLLFVISWIIGLTGPIFTVLGTSISGRDLILIGGGLFLLWEEHRRDLTRRSKAGTGPQEVTVRASFVAAIAQIMIIDIVFSLDSIITAVGMVDHLASDGRRGGRVGGHDDAVRGGGSAAFVERASDDQDAGAGLSRRRRRSSFIVEGFGLHVPKGYIYFSMAFAVGVESLNIRMRKRAKKAALRRADRPADADAKPVP